MNKIGIDELNAIALGSTVLGSGGGGDPYIGTLMGCQVFEKYGPVCLLQASDVPDDALVVSIAAFGAPVILLEKLFGGNEAEAVFELLESHYKKPIFATMPIEAGGLNCVIPFVAAAKKNIPVIDADGMGRAFPALQMVVFTLDGISASPMAQADEKGNRVLYETISNVWGETLLGSTVIPMGGSCIIGCYPLTGKQLKESAVLGCISKAARIGTAVTKAKKEDSNPMDRLLEVAEGKMLFQGKIVDVTMRTEGRWNKGTCCIQGIGDYKGMAMKLDFQNEFLIAYANDSVVACVPDLIAVLDLDTAKPITAETLQYGLRTTVIGMPCNSKWQTEQGIRLVGPRAFGYDFDYQNTFT